MELSKLQKEIVTSNESKIVVISAAASGKTTVLTERVRHLLKCGMNPNDICVITFTNLAAQELKDRLSTDYKDGLTISTIHGLANRFLCSHGINTSKIIKEEKFDKFFDLLNEHPECVSHIPYILLDEAQDSSSQEYEFIFDMIQPDDFFVVGDYRQSIYGFRGAEPEYLMRLSHQSNVKVFDMNENYRNGSNILTYAKRIISKGGLIDTSIPMRNGGTVYEGTYNIDNLCNWIESNGAYSDWAILTRTNTEVTNIMNDLKKAEIPCVTFKQGDMTKSQLENAMKSNTVKVLTFHSSKGLEWQNVAVCNAVWWGGDEVYRVNYVAATRARDTLLWLGTQKPKRRTYFK